MNEALVWALMDMYNRLDLDALSTPTSPTIHGSTSTMTASSTMLDTMQAGGGGGGVGLVDRGGAGESSRMSALSDRRAGQQQMQARGTATSDTLLTIGTLDISDVNTLVSFRAGRK